MEAFLKNYIQLANRNQNIVISFGKQIDDNIFDNKIELNKIENIISYLQKNHKT